MNLTALDLLAIGVPLALVLAVTFGLRRYMHTVADFLAASRSAGRYLIATSASEIYATVILMMTSMEVFSRVGFSLDFWNKIPGLVFFFLTLMGVVTYRYRETRTLTFHQLLEVRYSKSVRVLASFLNVLSGIFNFGILPAVAARFFVYFCGFPPQLHLLGATVPTFIVVMIVLMLLSLFMMVSGGQISVMVTDALEGMISSFFYLFVAVAILFTLTATQVRQVLVSGSPGQSYIDPFDIGGQPDFNGWYVVLGMIFSLYLFRGGAWQAGFVAAAKSAHESRMAQVLGTWRGASYGAMATLASIGAFTLLHHPDFASQRHLVDQGLQGVGNSQLETQLRMPMALGLLLTSGIKGMFCAVALFGILASQGEQLHRYGSTLLQDVVLPLRKKPMEPHEHVRWLKLSAVGIAIFACVFSALYKPLDYLVMITFLIGVIYLGGIGVVVWGALYWKRGTTEGALAALALAGTLGILLNLIQPFWPQLCPVLIQWIGPGSVATWLAAHTAKLPLNGLELSALVALVSAVTYIGVSLKTCREPFNLDAMLHRGKYRVVGEAGYNAATVQGTWLERALCFDSNFTRSDKFLVYLTLAWTLFWQGVAVTIILWTLFVGRLSSNWFVDYFFYVTLPTSLMVGVITTIWFAFGVTRDLRRLFVTLKEVKPNDADDGTVRNHHNLADEAPRSSANRPTTSPRDEEEVVAK